MGAPIPRVLVRQARDVLPGLAVLGGWGQTEEGLVTLGIPGDPEDKVIDTDGYPFPGMEIRVVDFDGVLRPAGEEGALQVRGPFVFVGYAERLEMTRALFREDPDGDWFDTGDLAHIDADGYLRISGRTKDVIIRGGENIPVSYVENVLYEHPDVDTVAVVAIPDPRLQERACACLVLKAGAPELTFAALQEFLAAKGVAKQYWPEKLVLLDDFPKTPSGKIQKFQLRDAVGRDA
jgi:acyl-CoA synthetase (AMP-forming)/AMP-acid ligase II